MGTHSGLETVAWLAEFGRTDGHEARAGLTCCYRGYYRLDAGEKKERPGRSTTCRV